MTAKTAKQTEKKESLLVMLPITEKRKIRMAAANEGISMSQFLANHGAEAADSILKKLGVSL